MAIIYSIIKNLPLIAVGIVGIGFIIGFHELGHFAFCKLFKVKTPSFSIGFGPQLIKKKIGETVFSLSAIPFGGYVEIAGIQEVGQGEQKEAGRKDKFSFALKPYYQKLLILSGGILFNIIIAYFLMMILFGLGAPKTPLLNADSIPPVIGKIANGSAAQKYGLQEGDTILAINKDSINSSLELHHVVSDLANKEINIMIQRDGQTLHKDLTVGSVKSGDKEIGQLGIQFAPVFAKPVPFFQAISDGFNGTNKMLLKMGSQFASIFKNKQYQSVGGPIMIISEVANSAKHGFRIFLLLLVIISLNLAILNLIPIPILDGGQILFTTIEAIIGRPIPESIRIGIHYACWVAAIALFAYLSYKDILKLFR